MRSNESRALAAGVIESIYFMSGVIPRPRWRVMFIAEILGWCALFSLVVGVSVLVIKAFA